MQGANTETEVKRKPEIELRKEASGRRKGMAGTIIIHLLLFGMLLWVGFSTPLPPEDTGEGILVNFGTGETGLGDIEPSPPAFKEESVAPPVVKEKATPPPSATKAQSKPKSDPTLTQDNEEAPAVKKPDPEAQKKRLERIEAEKQLKAELEAERVRQKAIDDEKKRVEAEQKRESDIMNRTKNALANSQNRGTSSTSEGIAGGTGNQGDPNGSIESKVRGTGSGLGTKGTGTGASGVSYSLQGRGFLSLPTPKYDVQEGGKVVVEVSVDRSGKVVQAIPGTKGSTTLDENLLRVAKEAALNARFEVKQDAPAVQKGTITYNFILK